MFYSSACSVYRHQSVYTEAEGKVHFSDCFLKGILLPGSIPIDSPRELERTPDFEFKSSWFCTERLEGLPWRPALPLALGADPEVQSWWYFFILS